ncbi:FAD-binding oxidoreductase [Thermogemmata fonticola]|uniref:FAD-binding protein n=1 Tax=Thermogemmata fonticola TaxID=2755323 RepID=A0A7V8VF34_9BACT|nr:FAD-binding oxidoreductase [Thermogemmata fonticola]MBA2226750.1 FAD-binding protein [Thermogemmata fonticola]
MAQASTTLAEDLRGLFRGMLRVDAVARRLYARDASIFEVEPQAVAIPQDADDLAVLLKYCQEHQLPVTARGAGTGLAGESVGAGVIVDLSVHFQAIRQIASDSVTVEAGVRYAALAAALAEQGRRLAPDPASGDVCTIGGMIATNASGSNLYRHGYIRDYVQELEVLWDNGESARLISPAARPCPLKRGESGETGVRPAAPPAAEGPRTADIRRGVTELLSAHRHLIACRPTATPYDRCGYRLDDVWTPAGVDLARLLVGSEGTLGLVTAARLRTIPLPGGCAMLLLGFASLEAAVRAGSDCRRFPLTACDLLDQRLLSLRRRPAHPGALAIPPSVAAALLVTIEADSPEQALERGWGLANTLCSAAGAVLLAEPSCDPQQQARMRAVRQEAVRGLYALGPGPRPLPGIEDLGVPAEELPAFIAALLELLQRREVTAALLIHLLTGQVHLRPLLDLEQPQDRVRLWTLAEEVHTLVLRLGGTVSTQHGVGWARTPWVERQVGPLYPLYRELKRIFDPRHLLNPGKIVGPDPSREAWPLYEPLPPPNPPPLSANGRRPLPLVFDAAAAAEAARCSRCGDCRTHQLPQRMCPLFRIAELELAAPRAKAELFRLLHNHPPRPEDLDALTQIADWCFLCEMCRLECDVHVDVPRLMLELKGQLHAVEGPRRFEWFLSRLDFWAAWGSRLAPLSNFLLRRRLFRWLLEKLTGLSRHRRLPRFARPSFFRWARRQGLTEHPPAAARGRFAYFVDLYAAYHDPSLAEAVVAVLRHHGSAVYVPPRQRSAGLGPWSAGDLEAFRELARHNVRLLAECVRDGYHIVCSEPTAALLLRRYYPLLLDDPEARLVAEHTQELTTLLVHWQQQGLLREDFQPLPWHVAHHTPCHLKALGGPAATATLLERVPALRVEPLEAGCSGMAGLWGQHAAALPLSLQVAQPLAAALSAARATLTTSECSACRLQLQHLTGYRSFHPVQLLALAYGLLPALQPRLSLPLPLSPLLSE